MIEQTALVLALDGELAEVEVQRLSACGDCSAKSGCGSALFANMFGKRRSRLRVLNPIQARPGERVVIGLRERPFLRAAFALYATPLLAMICGALAGEWLVQHSSSAAVAAELGALAGGLMGLIAGLRWLRRFARKSRNDTDYQPVVLRRAGNGGVFVQLR